LSRSIPEDCVLSLVDEIGLEWEKFPFTFDYYDCNGYSLFKV
jgi:hypothetical protein